GLGGVKFIACLEPRAAETGALRVLPGSHVPEYRSRIDEYSRCDPAGQGFDGWTFPGVVLQTEPGDVVAFDGELFHSSEGGHDRLGWTIEYRPWPGPGDRDLMALVRDSIVDAVDQDHQQYDRDRWPTWREWVAGARGVPSREVAVQRLRLLGVLGDGEPR
ncbi:MAG TPA: phytanoyl-CoA dioxygenase family protein, partial [Acidimicrobiales bacterium]|nr:phytanoyl-CoA dioxygenase family protein [Acidimicrobiales bacterium]